MKQHLDQSEDENIKRVSKEIVDKPTKDDLLGFKRFADPIARRIMKACDERTQLTIAVYGEWGCGKTSFLQMVDENLRTEGIVPIWFSAWKYDKEDNLWSALLQTILDQARINGSWKHRLNVRFTIWKDSIHLRDGLWEVVKKLFPAILRLLIIIAGLILLLGLDKNAIARFFSTWLPGYSLLPSDLQKSIVKVIGGITAAGVVATVAVMNLLKGNLGIDFSKFSHKPSYREHIAFLDEFSTEFQKIVRLLGHGKPLVVIIDDLDRCLPEKVIPVFEAIKNFLDVEGCVFLLALDRKMLEKAIANKYKEMNAPDADKDVSLRKSAFFHQDYMEKIVQLSLSLPRLAQSQIEDFVKNLSTDEDIQTCASIFAVGLPPNPRKIKRILRTFLFIRDMVVEDIRKGAIRTSLLGKLIVIQNHLSDVYEAIAEMPLLLPDLETYYHQSAEYQSQPSTTGENAIVRDRAEKYAVDYPELRRILLKKINSADTFIGADVNRYISLVGALAEVKPFQDELIAELVSYLQFVSHYTMYTSLDPEQPLAALFVAPYLTRTTVFPNQDLFPSQELFPGQSQKQEVVSPNGAPPSSEELTDMEGLLRQSSRILIQGPPGSGKTTIINYLAYDCARHSLSSDKDLLETRLGVQERLIPIIVRLYEYTLDFDRNQNSFMKFFEKQARRGVIPTTFFTRYLERGQCIVLFDGLDEIDARNQRLIIDEINALCALYPLNRYVIASRSYPYYNEQPYPLGFQTYSIMPWNDEQIRRYVQLTFAGTNNRGREPFLEMLSSDQEIKSLALRPLFLVIISQLFSYTNAIPRSRARLYDEVSKFLLNRYGGSAYHGEINPILMHDVLAGIAFEMQKDHKALISMDQVKRILAQKLGGDTGKQDQIIVFLIERIAGLIQYAPNLYGFMHISFQEYFASEALLQHSHVVQDALDLWQKEGQTWKEVIIFAVDSLSQTEQGQSLAEQLIRALLATQETRSILFAAECLLRKTNLSGEIIDALIKIEGNEDIEPVLREQAKEYKMKIQKEIDTLHSG